MQSRQCLRGGPLDLIRSRSLGQEEGLGLMDKKHPVTEPVFLFALATRKLRNNFGAYFGEFLHIGFSWLPVIT